MTSTKSHEHKYRSQYVLTLWLGEKCSDLLGLLVGGDEGIRLVVDQLPPSPNPGDEEFGGEELAFRSAPQMKKSQ
ncbi:MAG: hypothetical protein GY820_21960 [Gammaproteobacteria bacterium]|nr:hypothetical protein [Gammaproteobacteria bacterium]